MAQDYDSPRGKDEDEESLQELGKTLKFLMDDVR